MATFSVFEASPFRWTSCKVWFSVTVALVPEDASSALPIPESDPCSSLPSNYMIDFLSHVRYLLHVKSRRFPLKGDQLLAMLAALANPHRLRIIAALASGGRNYVSQLARELAISRPLLHLHLQKLEDAGLVTSQLELSQDGKALNYFEVRSFDFELTPAAIAEAAKSLTAKLEP
jgi:DNA-binding transcriptional ArsR family regulator